MPPPLGPGLAAALGSASAIGLLSGLQSVGARGGQTRCLLVYQVRQPEAEERFISRHLPSNGLCARLLERQAMPQGYQAGTLRALEISSLQRGVR